MGPSVLPGSLVAHLGVVLRQVALDPGDVALGEVHPAATARDAYVDGMTLVLLACAVVAAIGAALVRRFMPQRRATPAGKPAREGSL